MNPQLAQINTQIAAFANEDARTNGLRAILQQRFTQDGQERPAEWLDKHAEFLRSYIQFAPGNLITMWNAANERGKSAEFEPIAKMLIAYFIKNDDHIDDRLGFWGLLDDAYLTNYTLELINQKCKEQFGYYLIDFDFNKCNNTAAPFLGNTLNALQEEASKAVNKTENWTAVATLAAAVLGGLLLYGLFGGEDSAGFSFGETESPVAAPPEIAFNEVVTDETLARQQAELSRMQYNSRSAALIGLGPI